MKVCGADAKTRTIRDDYSFDRRVGCVALRLDIDGRQTTKQEAFEPDCDRPSRAVSRTPGRFSLSRLGGRLSPDRRTPATR
jgi:hypothetical protein